MGDWPMTIYDQGGLYADQHHYGFEETWGSTPVEVVPATLARELYEALKLLITAWGPCVPPTESPQPPLDVRNAIALYEREVENG